MTEEDRAILDALRSAFLRTNQEMYAYFKKNKLSPKVRGKGEIVGKGRIKEITFFFIIQ